MKPSMIMIFLILFSMNPSFSQSLSDSLISYFPFNGNADDASGNNFNGTVYGASLADDPWGSANNSFQFDGVNDFIDFSFNEKLQIRGDLSITFFMKVNSFDALAQGIISCLGSNQDEPENNIIYRLNFRYNGNSIVYGHESGSGNDHIHEFTSFSFNSGEWYHIAIVRDTLAKGVTLYVNGIADSTIHYLENPEFGQNATLRIGENSATIESERFFNGSLDEIRIYNRALDQNEIAFMYSSYNSGIADFTADTLSGNIPLTVNFKDLSINASSWAWDFNDDGIVDSYDQNPVHTFFAADSFDIRLSINGFDSLKSVLKENYIVSYQDSFPNLFFIEDVPEDQGGWVKVHFSGSVFDNDSLIFPKTASAELYTVEIYDNSQWLAAMSTTAYGKTYYSVLVPTLRDSSDKSDALSTFRVIASVSEGIFASNEHPGYSVDNLHPAIPQGLMALLNGDEIQLKWQANNEDDIAYYSVYKGQNGSIPEKITTTALLQYTDSDIAPGQNYTYSISATDYNGNESDLSLSVDLTVVNINETEGIPDKYYLARNFPNPFNPRTTIQFGLPQTDQVKITIFNALGQRVIQLLESVLPAGHHHIIWNGRNSRNENVNSGIYYYQIITDKFSKTRKMELVK